MTLFDPEPEAVPDDVARLRVALVVAYDGAPFHGVAENVGVRTVAGTLREALERVLGHPISLTVAGRTDRGVHAWGQVVTFDARADRLDPAALQRACNRLCRPSIVVRSVEVKPPTFDARFSATSRVYRYRVLAAPLPNPFLRAVTWHVAEPLDLNAMRLGADALLGEHDFSSFCRRPKSSNPLDEPASLVRDVRRIEWRARPDDVLEMEIEAGSFCHQMVRSITGTLVDVGAGRLRAGEVRGILAAKDRAAAGRVAPPDGLVLWEVRYDGVRTGPPPRPVRR